MIRIVIVDDHQIFIDGVKELMNSIDEIEVVGIANNGIDLIDLLTKQEADVILMDVNMPKMDGIEATKYVVKHYPETKVLMLTMHDSRMFIEKLIRIGAHGYVLKNTGKAELKLAIETVQNGKNYYSTEVTQRIIEGMQMKEKAIKKTGNVELTEREKDVLKLIAQELTSNEIAEKLFISHHTVESHRKNLIAKLGVRSVAGLVKYAVQIGLI
ncbi:MAG: DNA-binding response regulator [Bacteroidetes bacterium]|nr:MAG: DNA-binding response regulator [Bacteroidota bacterium]MBL1144102.1 DNA-binding response regulator [Bacteroidota bacterium]NOG56897.1 response regulator transcription factor [Bacteroidota bacterium]